jgi:HEPN domain-containing protein
MTERKPPSDARQLEEAQRWFAAAASDLLTVDLVLRPEPPLSDIAAFHLQQAAEKAAKALLIARWRRPPKSHDLETLSELLSDIEPAIAASLSALDRITSWAAVARYPDGEASPSVAEVRTASKEVRQFVATCEQAALSPKK